MQRRNFILDSVLAPLWLNQTELERERERDRERSNAKVLVKVHHKLQCDNFNVLLYYYGRQFYPGPGPVPVEVLSE